MSINYINYPTLPILNLLMAQMDLNFLILKMMFADNDKQKYEIMEDAISLVGETRSYFENITATEVVESVNNIKPVTEKNMIKKRLWRGREKKKE